MNGSPYYCAYGSTYSNWGLNSLPYYTALPATTGAVVVNAAATTAVANPNAVVPASATAPAPPQPGDPAAAPAPGDEKDSVPLTKEAAKEMYDAAQAAFKQGRYFQAIQKSGKAIESDLENVAMHDFLQQSMFALGDYRSAAIEAHAVLHLGKPTDWQSVAKLYADPAEYTDHLRTLENDVKENPGDAATQFLLGYHYNVLGHKPHAIKHLKKAFELAPKDEQASKLLTDLGEPPAAPAAPANPPAAAPPAAPAPPVTPPTSI